jgi:CheY-like chemotaxis protein
MAKPILLIEDDRIYRIWVRNALNELHVENELVYAADGKEALEYLCDNTKATPCLILLDLYMPKIDGIKFLRVAKSDCALKHIPVVVLTASPQAADVAMSFELGAAEYLKKGHGYNDLLAKMRRLAPYWAGSQKPTAVAGATNLNL